MKCVRRKLLGFPKFIKFWEKEKANDRAKFFAEAKMSKNEAFDEAARSEARPEALGSAWVGDDKVVWDEPSLRSQM